VQINLVYDSKTELLINGKKRIISLGDLAIRQGSSYTLTLQYDGDYSTWLPKSQIRDNYLEQGGVLLAEFNFTPLIYDESNNKTQITLSLKADVTSTIPSSKFQAKDNEIPNTNNSYVYDIELTDPNDSTNIIKIIDPSFVQVIPEVTDLND